MRSPAIKAIFLPIFFIVYIGIALYQISAIMDGVNYYTGISGFFGFVVAAFTTFIPLVGFGLGVLGAVNAWGWSILDAILLFGAPIILGVVAAALEAMAAPTRRRADDN